MPKEKPAVRTVFLCHECKKPVPEAVRLWDMFGSPYHPRCYLNAMPPYHPGPVSGASGVDPNLVRARQMLNESKSEGHGGN